MRCLFLFYSPSTVILIMASGLSYAHFFIENSAVLTILLCLTTVGFALICLYTSQDFQLKVAKFLTIIFALLMAYVTVGVAAQIGEDLYERAHPTTATPMPTTHTPTQWSPTSKPTTKSLLADDATTSATTTTVSTLGTVSTTVALSLGDKLPLAVSSLYLFGLMGIFLLAALLHFTEAYCLIHGIWYLFCLPSGYLLLIVYSVCNMTDRSWGK